MDTDMYSVRLICKHHILWQFFSPLERKCFWYCNNTPLWKNLHCSDFCLGSYHLQEGRQSLADILTRRCENSVSLGWKWPCMKLWLQEEQSQLSVTCSFCTPIFLQLHNLDIHLYVSWFILPTKIKYIMKIISLR